MTEGKLKTRAVYTYLLTYGQREPTPIAYLRKQGDSPDLVVFCVDSKDGPTAKRIACRLRKTWEERMRIREQDSLEGAS